ncbi:aspartate kinase [Vibrio panuliri]|uniref:Aspartokinase n=1 Tax=Vibrio panuliri TaxID=1381081 RepID=A0A1Q9HLB4_9VIBR|nr:aspartate kinase [Vibrio panuliri]KAB1459736.1 aspartate kinase [Vibrio panuliri]OLQ90059.1 aspartate kinase [Vibrio panuliri]OLQ91249.1 aspartate kinase [Vibrio panuliri]
MKKPLIVQKFGGTSVGSIERIHQVAQHIIQAKNSGNQVVVVVSAMSGETNRLLDLAKQVDSVPDARELDVLLAAGEQVSMALLAMTLNKMGYKSRSLTGAQANIVTDNQHNDATIKHIDISPITELLEQDQIVIVAGFQGITERGDITTLGRGGSDTSAVTLAGALCADECQIFTDVDGIYTCDPRVVQDAQKLDIIDFPSMEAMAKNGAKVLHLPSVQYAWKNRVPLRVLSTFDVNQGSLVKGDECVYPVSGLAIQRDMYLIKVAKSSLELIEKQCRLIGIAIWDVIEHPDWLAIVVKQDAYSKLELVLQGKVADHHSISLLTAVGANTYELLHSSSQLLASNEIVTIHQKVDEWSLTIALLPESVDYAANLLHQAYIKPSKALVCLQKHAFLN